MESYRILFVDDSIEEIKTMVSVFDTYLPDYITYQTNNSINALDIAKEVKADLIITDWDMPGMSGLDLIDNLKRNKETKDIPVIMLTGVMLTPDNLHRALDSGAVDYIRKPIEPLELIARTKSALLTTNYYNQIVNQKDQEITESSLFLVKSHEFISKVSKRLEKINDIIDSDPDRAKKELISVRNQIERGGNEESWYRFNLSFSRVHKEFDRNLIKKHPNLTQSDIRLCSFIRLGMSNKEIALVLNQSADSVKVTKYRLRKKVLIDSDISFENYLTQF
ncbi:MAG: response regulator [Bacteroidales bacterium]|jgi:CheY-like chemotaxis protein/DNA-binding CsgD family transcriptional regulator|nr:response regulator [Bacteroidales bacterium]